MEKNVIKGYLGYKGEQGLSAYEVAVANGFTGSVDEWLKSLGTSSMFSQFTISHETINDTSDFELPDEYIDGSIINVYMDGSHIAPVEYSIVRVNDEFVLRFNESVESGHTVEITALNVSTNNLPISSSLNNESTNDTASGSKAVYDKILEIQQSIPTLNSIVDVIYPIGSIYISTSSVDPSTFFTGTSWQPIKDRFLLASGDTYVTGTPGGDDSHSHSLNGTGFANIGTDEGYMYLSRKWLSNSWSGIGKNQKIRLEHTPGAFNDVVATDLIGKTGTASNMPPYLVVNVWKRTE